MNTSDLSAPAGLIQSELVQGQSSWILSGLGLLVLLCLVYMACLSRGGGRGGLGALSLKNAWRRRSDDPGPLLRHSLLLSPGQSVHEIHWHGQRLLIGCSPQTMAVLRQLPLVESDASHTDTADALCRRPDRV